MIRKSFEATGITLNESDVSNEKLKEGLKQCGESLKSQFGENFDSESFSLGISDEMYEYKPAENPFSDSDSDSVSENEIEY